MFADDDEASIFLSHHGKLGMHWGVRKAKFVAPPRVKNSSASTKKSTRIIIKDNTSKKVQSHKPLTKGEKELIGGAAVIGTLVAAKELHMHIDSGEVRRVATISKSLFVGKKALNFARNENLTNKSLNVEQLHSLVVKKINPNYGAIGTKQNCRRATFAYEMRRRGFDVKATKSTKATGQNAIGLLNAITPGKGIKNSSVFSTIKVYNEERATLLTNTRTATPLIDLVEGLAAGSKTKITETSSHGIFDALAKEPNGSRGEVGVMWSAGGGHSMAYEIVNNKPIIFDCQSGIGYPNPGSAPHLNEISSAGFTRLDNVPLNTDFLLRWLQNA